MDTLLIFTTPILIILISALCFLVGYKLGRAVELARAKGIPICSKTFLRTKVPKGL